MRNIHLRRAVAIPLLRISWAVAYYTKRTKIKLVSETNSTLCEHFRLWVCGDLALRMLREQMRNRRFEDNVFIKRRVFEVKVLKKTNVDDDVA